MCPYNPAPVPGRQWANGALGHEPMLASGGYPSTGIRVEEDRDAYLAALESASIGMDIRLFARFAAERVECSLEQAA